MSGSEPWPPPEVRDGHPAPVRVHEPRAIVASIEPGSIAEQLGLAPGDRIARINGQAPRDVIDWQLWTGVEALELGLETAAGEALLISLEKDPHEDLGIGFTDELFVPLRTCNNGCLFCFVLQAPPGMRPTVYVKDDDYRLSFLHGHFTTLTNLTEPHFERILHQRLSPLHVSVHASDPALRRELLANPKADLGWDYLARLVAAGIECHTQVVACPGVNDGARLDRTIADLAKLGPGVLSVGVVPVGLTRYQQHPLMRPMTAGEAGATIDQVDAWRERLGGPENRRVYAADELYLNAGRPLPDDAYYDDYAQYENGIGTVRSLLDEAAELAACLPRSVPERRVLVATGEYGALFLPPLVDALNGVEGLSIELVPVRNELFGGNVRCAGLLCGRDLVPALAGRPAEAIVLPARCLNDDTVLLDDVSLADLEARLGVPVAAAETFGELAAVACGRPIAVPAPAW